MYCTKCGAQIPDGSTFCTSCGARVGGAEDQAEPVAFPVEDATASAPAGQQAPQGAPVHMAAQPRYEEPMTEPAEASQPFVPTPQPKKPKHKGRIVAAVIGGVAVVAIVAAIVIVPRIGASSEVTSGGKGYVVCACETKVLPKNSKGKSSRAILSSWRRCPARARATPSKWMARTALLWRTLASCPTRSTR